MTHKFQSVGQIFGFVWTTQSNRSLHGDHAHFHAKSGIQNQNRKISMIAWIFHDQSIDNSQLSSQKNCSAKLDQKWLSYKNKNKFLNMGMCEATTRALKDRWYRSFKPNHNFGPLGEHCGSTVILKSCFRNFSGLNPPPPLLKLEIMIAWMINELTVDDTIN